MTLEAIRAMTIDAARQLCMENKLGSLEVGKVADIAVLARSPLDVAACEVDGIQSSPP